MRKVVLFMHVSLDGFTAGPQHKFKEAVPSSATARIKKKWMNIGINSLLTAAKKVRAAAPRGARGILKFRRRRVCHNGFLPC